MLADFQFKWYKWIRWMYLYTKFLLELIFPNVFNQLFPNPQYCWIDKYRQM
jgi:hypothetical protein